MKNALTRCTLQLDHVLTLASPLDRIQKPDLQLYPVPSPASHQNLVPMPTRPHIPACTPAKQLDPVQTVASPLDRVPTHYYMPCPVSTPAIVPGTTSPLQDCYGPPPPEATRISFSEMLESDHDFNEPTVSSCTEETGDILYTSQKPCHSCCSLIQELQARLTKVENELRCARLAAPVKPRQALQPRDMNVPSVTIPNTNAQALQETISREIVHETRMVKAMTKAMVTVFSRDQLVTCSMKGGATNPKGEIRQGLPIAERNALIDVISRQFKLPVSTVEEKMRGALRRLKAMYV